ncbi:MAG: GntR family transcriptional regulator [Acidobacteria bacterium]|nr:GntR family transcriptional regulator [Acidobacteriota bacterium]
MPRPFEFTLDLATGVPVYRQLIDQILAARATGRLAGGERLPTVRQVAVNLSINPNTVQKAYRELEIRGVLTTQQGTGTFLTVEKVAIDEVQRRQRLDQLASEFVARAGSEGYSLAELLNVLTEFERGQ